MPGGFLAGVLELGRKQRNPSPWSPPCMLPTVVGHGGEGPLQMITEVWQIADPWSTCSLKWVIVLCCFTALQCFGQGIWNTLFILQCKEVKVLLQESKLSPFRHRVGFSLWLIWLTLWLDKQSNCPGCSSSKRSRNYAGSLKSELKKERGWGKGVGSGKIYFLFRIPTCSANRSL